MTTEAAPFDPRWEDPADAQYTWNRGMGPYPRLYEDVMRAYADGQRRCWEAVASPMAKDHIVRFRSGRAIHLEPGHGSVPPSVRGRHARVRGRPAPLLGSRGVADGEGPHRPFQIGTRNTPGTGAWVRTPVCTRTSCARTRTASAAAGKPWRRRWRRTTSSVSDRDAQYTWNRGMGPYPRLYEDVMRAYADGQRRCWEAVASPMAKDHIVRFSHGWMYQRGPSFDAESGARLQ